MVQPFVSLQSFLLLCWHGFCDVNVTHSKSMKSRTTAEVDSTELADVRADWAPVYVRSITRSTMYQKAPFC